VVQRDPQGRETPHDYQHGPELPSRKPLTEPRAGRSDHKPLVSFLFGRQCAGVAVDMPGGHHADYERVNVQAIEYGTNDWQAHRPPDCAKEWPMTARHSGKGPTPGGRNQDEPAENVRLLGCKVERVGSCMASGDSAMRRGAEAESNPSKEPHRLFHFQRGGHAQSAFAASGFLPGSPCTIQGDWKGLLQTPGPRVPVLQLDPILAIDFCLGQNDGVTWRRLQKVPEYLMIVEGAQKRVWKPSLRHFKILRSGAHGLARRFWCEIKRSALSAASKAARNGSFQAEVR
jgi:hypothetical protein